MCRGNRSDRLLKREKKKSKVGAATAKQGEQTFGKGECGTNSHVKLADEKKKRIAGSKLTSSLDNLEARLGRRSNPRGGNS